MSARSAARLPGCVLSLLLLSLAGGASAARSYSNGTSGAPTGPKMCKMKIDPHVWVQHRHACSQQGSDEEKESIGCALMDLTRGYSFGNFGTEVHWTGSDYEQVNLRYKSASTTGFCSDDYHMPDYCSRAIVSELSTIYDGHHRKTSLAAGVWNLLNTKSESCSTAMMFTGAEDLYASVMDPTPEIGKACWGLGQDWRNMYCAKYARCACEHDGGCQSQEKIQCCRDQYQLFLDDARLDQTFGGTAERRSDAREHSSKRNARTAFSIRVQAKSDGAWRERWLRLAYRMEEALPLPTVFLELSQSNSFLDHSSLDLCSSVTPQVTDSGELKVGDWTIRLAQKQESGPGMAPGPDSVQGLKDDAEQHASAFCPQA